MKDEGRWRVLFHSENLTDFLVERSGLTIGPSAREKEIPDAILRSPEPVVRAFLRAYFDCDGNSPVARPGPSRPATAPSRQWRRSDERSVSTIIKQVREHLVAIFSRSRGGRMQVGVHRSGRRALSERQE